MKIQDVMIAMALLKSPVTQGLVQESGEVFCMECNPPVGVACEYRGITVSGADVWGCPVCGEEFTMSMFDWANMEEDE